jgi:hypothetical protein
MSRALFSMAAIVEATRSGNEPYRNSGLFSVRRRIEIVQRKPVGLEVSKNHRRLERLPLACPERSEWVIRPFQILSRRKIRMADEQGEWYAITNSFPRSRDAMQQVLAKS